MARGSGGAVSKQLMSAAVSGAVAGVCFGRESSLVAAELCRLVL